MPIRSIDVLCALPDKAIVSSSEAGVISRRHVETLRRWRRTGVGPRWLRHPARPDVAEYQIGDVRDWMAKRAAPDG
jgi:hypothetical protein